MVPLDYTLFRWLLVIVGFAYFSSTCEAQTENPLIIDLAKLDPGAIYSEQGNRAYSHIVLRNTLPEKPYSIEINKARELFPFLPLPERPKASKDAKILSDECKELKIVISNVENYIGEKDDGKTEREFGRLIKVLEDEQGKKSCNDSVLVAHAKILIGGAKRERFSEVSVGTGEAITVIVTRDSLKWIYILKGEEPGTWALSYGFGFTTMRLESRRFFLQQVQDSAIYTVQKERMPDVVDLNYIPAIFYSYLPNSKYNDTWVSGITAGLGFDLKVPVVFLGGSCVYRHNIGISYGIAFQQQLTLKPQYSEKQRLTTVLDRDQLHDKVYKPNLFISVNFRFGENPFSGGK